MSKQELKQKGFTIIEVVLVLAIAALIFLMVFIALPALQSSQRDTARKNDVSIVAAAVNSWSGNNRGTTLSSMTGADVQAYATNLSDNTTKTSITVQTTQADVTPTDAAIKIAVGSKCGAVTPANGAVASKVALTKGTIRQYATITKLEAASGTAYCLDS